MTTPKKEKRMAEVPATNDPCRYASSGLCCKPDSSHRLEIAEVPADEGTLPTLEDVRDAYGDRYCRDSNDPRHKTEGCPADAKFNLWHAAELQKARAEGAERALDMAIREGICDANSKVIEQILTLPGYGIAGGA